MRYAALVSVHCSNAGTRSHNPAYTTPIVPRQRYETPESKENAVNLRKSSPWRVCLSAAVAFLLVFFSGSDRSVSGERTGPQTPRGNPGDRATGPSPAHRSPPGGSLSPKGGPSADEDSRETMAGTGVTGKIAYMSSTDRTNWDLMIMDLDGTGQENLSHVLDPGSLCSDTDPHFKPDGSNIVFSRKCTGGTVQRIYTMTPDGSTVTALSPAGVSYSAETPKYSWDGTMVVFRKAGPQNSLACFQVSNPSGTLANVPNTSYKDLWPSFSPDGQWVVFQRMVTSQTMKICRIKLDGSSLTELTDGTHLDEMPYYSPDGQYIVFKRGGNTSEPKTDIYRIDASDGGNPTNLTDSANADEDAPIYSWEGTYLAYQAIVTGSTATQIFLADADGGNVLQLTSDAAYNWNPTFSPMAQSQPTLTVEKSGTGMGTIASEDGEIECDSACTEASHSYDSGTQVILNASAEPGSTFAGWSGGGCSGTGPCTVTLDEDTAVVGSFVLDTYSISGKVKTETGAGLPEVTVSLTGAAAAATQTDDEGGFEFSGLSNGTYTVTPGKNGYTFSPDKWIGNIDGGDLTIPDFTGTAVVLKGSLKVTITPAAAVTAGARWRVDGGAWRTSGKTVSNLSVGTHTVSFKAVSGWKTPGDRKVTVSNGMVANAGGKYIQQKGSLKVTITPAAAVAGGAKWRVDGGVWRASGKTVSNLSVGTHTVSFKAVSGWKTPGARKISIANGKTTAITARYTR